VIVATGRCLDIHCMWECKGPGAPVALHCQEHADRTQHELYIMANVTPSVTKKEDADARTGKS